MDLKTIQGLQQEVNNILEFLELNRLDPSVEVAEAGTISVELSTPREDSESEENQGFGLLIGPRGETLLALEYLLAMIVNRGREEWYRVHLDVDGYRKRRRSELVDLAHRLADKARASRDEVVLKPMPGADRRIVHMTLSEVQDVLTESTGEGRGRRVVIKPA